MKNKFVYTAPANGYGDWNNNPEISQLNRIDAHVNVFSNERQSLNGKWKFKLVDKPAKRNTAWLTDGFDYSGWDEITVPGHWQLQGFDYPQYTNIRYPWEADDAIAPPFAPENYNPVGYYRTEFTCPAEWPAGKTVLSFQGVESAFYLWINGEMAGYSQDSFTPAEFDISAYIREGKNQLAAEVFRWCDGSWL
jgi:beta-galactosidase